MLKAKLRHHVATTTTVLYPSATCRFNLLVLDAGGGDQEWQRSMSSAVGAREHAKLWGSLRCNSYRLVIIVRRTKAWIVLPKAILKRAVEHGCPNVEEGLHRHPALVHFDHLQEW